MDCTQQLGNYVAETRPVDEIGYLGILGEVHTIKMGPNKIGRDASFCDITIDKPSLSRQHAVINVLSDTEFMLMDLGSVNKTKVGVKLLQPYLPHPLRNGDTVQFGDVFGIFRLFQLPDTQVEFDIPETPVCTKVVSRFAQPATILELPDVSLPGIQVKNDSPETPVGTKVASRFAQPATVPESPDVSDKEGSFIASSQPPKHDNLLFTNALRRKEASQGATITCKSEDNLKAPPAKHTANDSVFWNASTQSPSINFNLDDSETSFNVSKQSSVDSKLGLSKVNSSGGKSSLGLKRNNISAVSLRTEMKLSKEEFDLQEIGSQTQDDKRLTIHEMETQNEFEISCDKRSYKQANKTASLNIHEQATQLDFLNNKASINQSGTEEKAMEKENNIFEAETQLFADQDTFILDDNDKSGNDSVHNKSNNAKDEANITQDTSAIIEASVSDEEILFNEFEGQGFDPFPGLQESQSLINNEAEIEMNNARNGAVSPILPIKSPIKTTPTVSNDRVPESKKNFHQDQAKSQDSDCSTDCEDDIIVKNTKKLINVFVESDDDSTDCEENEVIVDDVKILSPTEKQQEPVQPEKTGFIARNLINEINLGNIADVLTQVLPVDVVQSPLKNNKNNSVVESISENLADALTQVFPVEKSSNATVEDDFANAPTQQITPNNTEKPPIILTSGDEIKKVTKTVSVIESENTHAFKKPLLSTPFKLKRTAGLTNKESSPNISLMKGFTPLKSSPSKCLSESNRFYNDTQDLLDDLSSQKENCEANIDDPKPVDISGESTQKLYSEPQNSSVEKYAYYDTTQAVLADMLTQQLPEDTCNSIPGTKTKDESQDEDLMQLTRCVTPQGGMRENLTNTRKMLETINDMSRDDDLVPSSQDDDDRDVERFPHITKELSTVLSGNQDKDVVLDTSKSSSDGIETANKYVNSLTTQQVREVVGDLEAVDSAKKGIVQKSIMKTPVKRQCFDSDTSDLELTPRKQRSLFEIELPNSEEIKTSVELKKTNRTVLESSSDSDTGTEEETDASTPIVHRRKVRSKRKTERKLPDLTGIAGLPKRVLTRVRKPTEKLNENAELKHIITLKEFRSPEDNEKWEGIPVDIIAENIEKLKSRKNSRLAKYNKIIEKNKLDEAKNKLIKEDKIESNNENKKMNPKTSDKEKLANVKIKASDVNKGKTAKIKEQKQHVEIKAQVSDQIKTRSRRTTRHQKDKEFGCKIQNDEETATDNKEAKEESETDKRNKRHHTHKIQNKETKESHTHKTRSKERKESSSSEQKIHPIEVQKENVENEVTVLENDVLKNKNGGDLPEKEKKRRRSIDKCKNRNSDKEIVNGVTNAPPQEIKLKSILRHSSNDTKKNTSGKDTSSEGSKKRSSKRIRNSETTKFESTSSQLEDLIDETKKPKVSNIKSSKIRESKSTKKNIAKQQSTDSVVADHSTVFETTISQNARKSSQGTRKRVAEDMVSTVSTPKRVKSGNLEMSPSIAKTGTPSRLSLRQKHSILFTAFSNEKMMTAIKKLGAGIVTDALSCTVVVTARVKRTFKLLCAVGLGKPIVGQTWMQACIDAGTLVATGEFMMKAIDTIPDPWLYILEDIEVENRFKFKLSTTLRGPRNFLEGYSISATPSVLPAATEMKQIVECSGGRWGESRSSSGHWFCVTCIADRLLWPNLRKRGAVLVTSELVLCGVLTQQLNPKGCTIPDT